MTVPEWRAGRAQRPLDPSLAGLDAVYLAGYAHRALPCRTTRLPLFTKALALQAGDANTAPLLLLTADLVGVSADLTAYVRAQLAADPGLAADRIRIVPSHTHSGPCLTQALCKPHPLTPLWEDAEEQARVRVYSDFVAAQMVAAAREALGCPVPVSVQHGQCQAGFAANRRENAEPAVAAEIAEAMLADVQANGRGVRRPETSPPLQGPTDPTVDLLVVRASGSVTAPVWAVIFGYACHCTVLDANEMSGDWAGYAQAALERDHPDSLALFVPGCGGDQNPVIRRHVALAVACGEEIAHNIICALSACQQLAPVISVARTEVSLPLYRLPTRSELEAQSAMPEAGYCPTLLPPNYDSSAIEARNVNTNKTLREIVLRARAQWAELMQSWPPSDTSIEYPVSCWQLGSLTWLALAGEPVIDYALRLKTELPAGQCWITGYWCVLC